MNTYKKHLTRVVVPSRFFIEKFSEWGWPREKFVYIPNYIDAAAFEPRYEPGDYFLYFGRVAPEKGLTTLLKAAHAAQVSLKIVGTGPEANTLMALSRQLGVGEFHGYQTGATLHELIRNARAVVLPSEWYENAPMSALESFALGKPLLGAHIGGIPELIEDGVNGWTFQSCAVEELAAQLRAVAQMKNQTLLEMGIRARTFVEERFSGASYRESVLSLYSDLGVPS